MEINILIFSITGRDDQGLNKYSSLPTYHKQILFTNFMNISKINNASLLGGSRWGDDMST